MTNGKDRTFFFVSYEGTRQRRSESTLNSAPRASWRQGDFRDVLGAGPDLILGTGDDVANSNQIRCLTSTGARVVCPTPNVIPQNNVGRERRNDLRNQSDLTADFAENSGGKCHYCK